jgi:hypothetical protein
MSMTVKQLIEALKKENQDALVVMSKDGEGNSYSPLHEARATTYKATRAWDGQIDDDSKPSKKNGTVAAVVLWPTN